MIRSAIAGLAVVFGCVACSAPAKSPGALRDISGVARQGDTLLLVDDETPGAYLRFPLASPTPRIFPLLPDSILRHELPGSSLFLDAESIAVLGDGRIVVLSERLRGLVGSKGLIVEYPASFSEFGKRGIEGLSVFPLPDGGSRIAVLWEGGYPLNELAAGQALKPKLLIHDLAPMRHGLRLRTEDVDVVRLNVATPSGEEPQAQRFRAPDLVWSQTGEPGFIVLLGSENGVRPRTYGHHWLQRFSRKGEPVGECIDLNRLAPAEMQASNWEGLDWFVPQESLIVVCERSPMGPGVAMIVDLPEAWRQ